MDCFRNVFDKGKPLAVGLLKSLLTVVLIVVLSQDEGPRFQSPQDEDSNAGIFFSGLSDHLKTQVRQRFLLARKLYIKKKYDLALEEIQKVHAVVPFYKNSRSIEADCKTWIELKVQIDYIAKMKSSAAELVKMRKEKKGLLRRAKAGDLEAQFELAERVNSGRVESEDVFQEAMKWYRTSAEKGHVKAQCQLGKKHLEKENLQKAMHWFSRASRGGDAEASFLLAKIYHEKKDLELAETLYRKAVFQGSSDAETALGLDALFGEVDFAPNDLISCHKAGLFQSILKSHSRRPQRLFSDESSMELFLTRRAREGHVLSQYLLAVFLMDRGRSLDLSAAGSWFLKAAESGFERAYQPLGLWYLTFPRQKKDLLKGVEWTSKAAELGNAAAQLKMAQLYMKKQGVLAGAQTILSWLHSLADKGRVDAMYALGEIYQRGDGVEPNRDVALRWFKTAAEGWHLGAQKKLATLFSLGGEENKYWLRRAAAQGDAESHYKLATMLDSDSGIEKNEFTALIWYMRASELGDGRAQMRLGEMYRKGIGTPVDSKEALRQLRRAADRGFAGAQFQIGQMYQLGEGTEPDLSEALKWFNLAANESNEARTELGRMYKVGKGVDKNLEVAASWLKKATEEGHAEAIEDLVEIIDAGAVALVETLPGESEVARHVVHPAYTELSDEERRHIRENFRVALALLMKKEFALALGAVEQIHELVPFYRDSQRIAQESRQWLEVQAQREYSAVKRRLAEDLSRRVSGKVRECESKMGPQASQEEIVECLGDAFYLNPEHPDILKLLGRFQNK